MSHFYESEIKHCRLFLNSCFRNYYYHVGVRVTLVMDVLCMVVFANKMKEYDADLLSE